jgi:hypothetical protein
MIQEGAIVRSHLNDIQRLLSMELLLPRAFSDVR